MSISRKLRREMPAFASFGRFGEFWAGSAKRPVRANNTFHIVYTGSIYGAQLDAVRRLVHVVNQEIGAEWRCTGKNPTDAVYLRNSRSD